METKQKCETCTKFHYTAVNHGWCTFLRMEIRGNSILAGKCESFKISNLKINKIKTLKKLFESVHSGSWKLTHIRQSYKGDKYIFEAKTRFFQGFEKQNNFYKVVSKKYADTLCMEYFGKKTSDLTSFTY